MAQPERKALTGTALQFAYDGSGQLTRSDISSCSWMSGSARVSKGNASADSAAAGKQAAAAAGGESGGAVLEYWYSSGGYTKVPANLEEHVAAGKPLVIEAGALIPASAVATGPPDPAGRSGGPGSVLSKSSVSRSSYTSPAGVTRWLLSYSASDGLLETARLEQYQL